MVMKKSPLKFVSIRTQHCYRQREHQFTEGNVSVSVSVEFIKDVIGEVLGFVNLPEDFSELFFTQFTVRIIFHEFLVPTFQILLLEIRHLFQLLRLLLREETQHSSFFEYII